MALQVGDQAPDFTLKTSTPDGLKEVTLSENYGKTNSLLLFFPAAFTGVCTDQLCDASGGLGSYHGKDVEVYGISADSPFAQAAWAKANNINVTLLSDYDRKVIDAFGTTNNDFAGLGKGSWRAAFLVDKEGKVRYAEVTPELGQLPNQAGIDEAIAGL